MKQRILTDSNLINEEELLTIIKELVSSKFSTTKAIFFRVNIATQLLFMYYLGLRPNSVRLIEIKRIDFKNRKLFIPRSNIKTRQDDTFIIPEKLYNFLIAYLRLRSKNIHRNSFLFPSPYTEQPLDRNTISSKIRKIMKRINLSQLSFIDKAGFNRMSKNLYSLRHSFATRVYEKTRDVRATAIMLGHTDIMMRQACRYIHISRTEDRLKITKAMYDSEIQVSQPDVESAEKQVSAFCNT